MAEIYTFLGLNYQINTHKLSIFRPVGGGVTPNSPPRRIINVANSFPKN